MKKLMSTTIFFISLVSGPAWAADPMVESAYDWSGFYVGVNAGYGSVNYDTTDIDAAGFGPWNVVGDSWSFNADGLVAGVGAGYNYQSGSFVFGLEGDLGFLNADGSEATQTSIDTVAEFDANWYGTLRARAGLAANRTLFYVTGGAAVLDADFGVSDFIANSIDTRANDTLVGWTAGGGVEWAVTDELSLKAEYLYMDFGKTEHSAPRLVPASNVYGFDHDITAHVARVGINWHF